jgi:peptidoglycan-associated lipoprotein
MLNSRKLVIVWATIILMVFAAGCKKKIPPPPPPPLPAAPVIAQFAANPTSIQSGQSSNLSWQVTGEVTNISIDQGVGTVQNTGSHQVTPTATTTYTLTATGPGGSVTKTATVNVAPVVVRFGADPATIQRGQSSNLSWQVTGATTVSINQGIGTVQSTGSSRVMPNASTTYTLTATGPGGTTTQSATVTVTAPPPPPPPPAAPKPTIEQRLFSEVRDAFFDYDKSDLRSDARDALTGDASALKAILADFPNATIAIEGHCDERGSAEYNLGLGDRRSSSAKDLLVQLGVPADKLKTISYGKERPQCTESTEECWQKNRRVHFVPAQ